MQSIPDFLTDYLARIDFDIVMATVTIKEIEAATGLTITRTELEQAAAELVSTFYLVVRGPDDFCNDIYIWITPKPSDTPVTTPPDPCWVIMSPDRGSTRQIDDGLLVFSKSGYAIGLMAAQGFGDFNVEKWSWQDLAVVSKRDTAVIDYVEGRSPNIIPFRS